MILQTKELLRSLDVRTGESQGGAGKCYSDEALMRPLLEYHVQFWCPQFNKDVMKQKRARKNDPRTGTLPYCDKFEELGLFISTRKVMG